MLWHSFGLFQTKIVDDNGLVVPVNKRGHLKVRGYSSFMYYMGDEEKTKEMRDENEWINTGYVYCLITITPSKLAKYWP